MPNAQAEPSMEEILASIRRIISDDGEEDAAVQQPALRSRPVAAMPAATPAASAPTPTARPSVVKKDEPPSSAAAFDEDRAQSHLITEDVEMIKKNVTEAARDLESVVVEEAAASAASRAFQNLSQTVRIAKGEGRTLEDIVVEILRPMVKQWLDENLPQIVEEKVEAEVQRVARLRR